MSIDVLKELITQVSVDTDRYLQEYGQVDTVWLCFTEDATMVIPCMLDDPSDMVEIVRAIIKIDNICQYVFMSEAWERTEMSSPPREVVIFSAEDRDGGQVLAKRYLTRGERVSMGELQFYERVAGQMTSLMPTPKTRH